MMRGQKTIKHHSISRKILKEMGEVKLKSKSILYFIQFKLNALFPFLLFSVVDSIQDVQKYEILILLVFTVATALEWMC
jgi:hypothetical protein